MGREVWAKSWVSLAVAPGEVMSQAESGIQPIWVDDHSRVVT